MAGRIDFGQICNTTHNVCLTASWTNLFTAKFKKDVASENISSGSRLSHAPEQLPSAVVGCQNRRGFDARPGADRVSEQFAYGEKRRWKAESSGRRHPVLCPCSMRR